MNVRFFVVLCMRLCCVNHICVLECANSRPLTLLLLLLPVLLLLLLLFTLAATTGAAPGQDPTPKGGGGTPPPLYGPQNCRTEQGALSAPEAPEILF